MTSLDLVYSYVPASNALIHYLATVLPHQCDAGEYVMYLRRTINMMLHHIESTLVKFSMDYSETKANVIHVRRAHGQRAGAHLRWLL